LVSGNVEREGRLAAWGAAGMHRIVVTA